MLLSRKTINWKFHCHMQCVRTRSGRATARSRASNCPAFLFWITITTFSLQILFSLGFGCPRYATHAVRQTRSDISGILRVISAVMGVPLPRSLFKGFLRVETSLSFFFIEDNTLYDRLLFHVNFGVDAELFVAAAENWEMITFFNLGWSKRRRLEKGCTRFYSYDYEKETKDRDGTTVDRT